MGVSVAVLVILNIGPGPRARAQPEIGHASLETELLAAAHTNEKTGSLRWWQQQTQCSLAHKHVSLVNDDVNKLV